LSRNLKIKDPPDVGFLTGIGAVILVDVTTQVREAPADTRDIYMVHAMFRRKFAALPTIVRGVAAADAERADLISEHMGLLTAVLEAHHRADETHLWPKLLDRGGEDLGPIVHVMEEQHNRIEQLTAKGGRGTREWREDTAAERSTRLAPAP
jgi:iron-sulfur cluster repair protein YtfE (RIC family)